MLGGVQEFISGTREQLRENIGGFLISLLVGILAGFLLNSVLYSAPVSPVTDQQMEITADYYSDEGYNIVIANTDRLGIRNVTVDFYPGDDPGDDLPFLQHRTISYLPPGEQYHFVFDLHPTRTERLENGLEITQLNYTRRVELCEGLQADETRTLEPDNEAIRVERLTVQVTILHPTQHAVALVSGEDDVEGEQMLFDWPKSTETRYDVIDRQPIVVNLSRPSDGSATTCLINGRNPRFRLRQNTVRYVNGTVVDLTPESDEVT